MRFQPAAQTGTSRDMSGDYIDQLIFRAAANRTFLHRGSDQSEVLGVGPTSVSPKKIFPTLSREASAVTLILEDRLHALGMLLALYSTESLVNG